jgi:hypothetical protein
LQTTTTAAPLAQVAENQTVQQVRQDLLVIAMEEGKQLCNRGRRVAVLAQEVQGLASAAQRVLQQRCFRSLLNRPTAKACQRFKPRGHALKEGCTGLASGVTATHFNPRPLHGIRDTPAKPMNLPRQRAIDYQS